MKVNIKYLHKVDRKAWTHTTVVAAGKLEIDSSLVLYFYLLTSNHHKESYSTVLYAREEKGANNMIDLRKTDEANKLRRSILRKIEEYAYDNAIIF